MTHQIITNSEPWAYFKKGPVITFSSVLAVKISYRRLFEIRWTRQHFLSNTEANCYPNVEGRRERKKRRKWISQQQTWYIAFGSLYPLVIIPSIKFDYPLVFYKKYWIKEQSFKTNFLLCSVFNWYQSFILVLRIQML